MINCPMFRAPSFPRFREDVSAMAGQNAAPHALWRRGAITDKTAKRVRTGPPGRGSKPPRGGLRLSRNTAGSRRCIVRTLGNHGLPLIVGLLVRTNILNTIRAKCFFHSTALLAAGVVSLNSVRMHTVKALRTKRDSPAPAPFATESTDGETGLLCSDCTALSGSVATEQSALRRETWSDSLFAESGGF